MVNSTEFSQRLQTVISYYNESASGFAEKIGVQRSSISHILSGRNKPSLDFVLKILSVYEEVDLYWLLKGKGTFPKQGDIFNNTTENSPTPQTIDTKIDVSINETTDKENSAEINANNKSFSSEDIDRIVIFYKNGTFKHYTP